MFSTAGLEATRLTKDELFARVSEEQVLAALGLEVELGQKFCSPFRPDSHADCKLYLSSSGHIRFADYANGLDLDVIDLVRYAKQLPFQDALRWIADTCLGTGISMASVPLALALARKPEKAKSEILIKRMSMDGADYAWWAQFNISKSALEQLHIVRISDYWVNGTYVRLGSSLGYAYCEEDGFKLYFPHAEKKRRFLSTTKVLAGYDLLPETGELLLITSSKKDVGTLRSFGYEAVAPQGEGMDLPTGKLWELKQRFQKIVLFYDNDEAGLKLAAEKVEKWQVTGSVCLPEGAKDPSDYCKLHGAAAAKHMFTQLLQPYALHAQERIL